MTNYDFLYDKNFFGDSVNRNHFSNKRLHFAIIDNGTILPHKALNGTNGFGGIVDKNGEFIPRSAVHWGTNGAYTPTEKIQYNPATVIYFGMLVDIWGHCITDGLKRVWFFFSEMYQKYFRNCPVVYTPMWNGIVPNFARLLEILGVDPKKMFAVTTPTRFQNIILPDESFFLGGSNDVSLEEGDRVFFTQEYIQTVERAKIFAAQNFKPLAQKKFYFFHGKKQVGEERIAEYFRSKGYEIIHPEKLSFDEELNILLNAESYCSTDGSISHNMIFCKPDTEVIILPRYCEGNWLLQYQQALDQAFKMRTTYIDTALSVYAPSHNGIFFYAVSNQLRAFFGDEPTEIYDEETIDSFLGYVRLALQNRLPMNQNALKYYAKILPNFMEQIKQRPDLMQKHGVNLA